MHQTLETLFVIALYAATYIQATETTSVFTYKQFLKTNYGKMYTFLTLTLLGTIWLIS